MSIEFRRLTDAGAAHKQEAQIAPLVLWIPPANKLLVEERLFHFFCSLCDGSPQAPVPLLVEVETLHALYNDPHPQVILALRHCLDQFLVDLSPDPARWGTLDLPTTVLGIALAAYNCLCPRQVASAVEDPVIAFTSALIATLPPARTLGEIVTYHALLAHIIETLPFLAEDRTILLRSLLNLSPLSAISYLHLYTPPPLTKIAAEFWPWWEPFVLSPTPWTDLEDWVQVLTILLEQPIIASFLRRRWLSMPETRPASRNLGLLLEAFYRQGAAQRKIILEFYEAFAYFCAEQVIDPLYKITRRHWPLLNLIERLLRANGNNEAAIELNRVGNEYFALFSPLLKIIIAEKGLPRDYYHLTPDFIAALRYLVTLTTEVWVPRTQLQNITFSSGEDES